MEINKLHELFLQSKGVSSDTRKIEEDSMFFALKGENFDGNKFAHQAIETGASFSVVDDQTVKPHQKIIEVDDVLETLQQLATFHRQYLKIPIVALTGSNGKTTTKELLNAVLTEKYRTTATQGNLNNHIGVPFTLLSMNNQTEIGIVEMGANHPREIASLCEIARPDYGYITNFGKAHLEGFGGIEGVIKAKSELYDFLRIHHKTIFVNADDKLQMKQSKGATRYFMGEANTADSVVNFIEANPFVEISFDGLTVKSKLIGKYNAKNISAAIGIGSYFEVEPEKMKKTIENYAPKNNRSQIIEQHGNKVVLDAYNANPTSMAAALESFNELQASTKIVILGDMFEVGENSMSEHRAVVAALESYDFDQCFLCGNNFYQTKKESDKIKWFKNFEKLKEKLQNYTFSKSTVLIKGSRGMALERAMEYI